MKTYPPLLIFPTAPETLPYKVTFGEAQPVGPQGDEGTQYAGTHWVEASIIKDGICVAKSGRRIVRVRESTIVDGDLRSAAMQLSGLTATHRDRPIAIAAGS